MIELLVQIIILIVVAGLLWYALNLALTLLPINAQVRTAITVIGVLVLVLVILSFFGGSIRWPLR